MQSEFNERRADYVHQSVKIKAKLQSPIGDSRYAVKITDR